MSESGLGLRSLRLRCEYRSSADALGRDFLDAVLARSTKYDRAVAYFSSSVFLSAQEGFGAFFDDGHVMRLVCAPVLSARDADAFRRAATDRRAALDERRSASEILAAGEHVHLLSVLLVRGQLVIKVSVGEAPTLERLYHEKIGLLRDSYGHVVAFSGSVNETRAGWQTNFERLDVFSKWLDGQDAMRAKRIELAFDSLWRDTTSGVRVMPWLEAMQAGLLQVGTERSDGPHGGLAGAMLPALGEVLWPMPELSMYPHQEEAIQAWAAGGGRGILEMATGSGKTLTALTLVSRLRDQLGGQGLAIVIVAPLLNLVDQWIATGRMFGLRPTRCADSAASWQSQLLSGVMALNAGKRMVLSIVVTSSTLLSEGFQSTIARIRRPMILIGDEVHNFGTAKLTNALPNRAQYRLGLSATPERWMDEDGTDRITGYFGDVAFRFGLAEAIDRGILTRYDYYPVVVDFSPDELDQYVALTKRIGKLMHADAHDSDAQDALQALLIRRARLVAAAGSKVPRLQRLLAPRTKERHILIYCGDGEVEVPDSQEMIRQVDAVIRMVGRELGMTVGRYTSETSSDQRSELLRSFAAGDIQVLVAIRCLDEGVDIPATRTAYILASSSNPRQHIQRRGRVLRKSPGKECASVYDFVVTPELPFTPMGMDEFNAVRGLLEGQIRRASEFAALASNGPVARGELLELTSQLGLLSTWS